MNDKTSRDSSEVIVVLRRAVASWPKTDGEKDLRTNASFAELITSDFDRGDLGNQIVEVASVVSVDGVGSRRHVVFKDADGYVYRASLVLQEKSPAWRLQALKFQCPICFGDGTNDGRQCTMCGGSGWGVAP